MAAVTIGFYQDWMQKGVSRTRWNLMTGSVTGDIGAAQSAYGLQGSITILITSSGSIGSLGVLNLEESGDAVTWAVANSVCGTPLTFDSATAVGLTTGIAYQVRPGALFYRPKWAAGASGTDTANVTLIQRA